MNISININIPFKAAGSKIAKVATQTDMNDIASATVKSAKFVGNTATKVPSTVVRTSKKVANTTSATTKKVARKVHTPKETTEA